MIIVVLGKKGEDATDTVARVLKTEHTEPDGFRIATPTICMGEKDAENLQSQRVKSVTAVGYTVPCDETQSARLENATLVFTGRIYSPTQTPIADNIAKKLEHNRDKTLEALFEVEGDFAFILAEPEIITAGRDPIGVQPLYYGENRSVAALAANRKALWKLGIEKAQSFPPGHLAVVSREGFKFKPIKTFNYAKQPKPTTMQEAAETLQKLLENSVRNRVEGLREVAVAFSGGLDSSIVAFLAKEHRVNVHLIHISLKNQAETEEAKKAAEELNLPIQVHLFEEADVEKVVAKVVELIEEPDPIKTAIGVPFYWIAKKTAEAGFKALLAGQGADELFGGYQRYVNEYLMNGAEKVRRTMFDDVIRIHETNLERDVKICSFHGVELRLPFASCAVADFASSLPLELKIERKADSLRKLVLRKVAENMGLPTAIAEKPKKAVQYSTGINNALKKIANKHKKTTRNYVNALFFSEYGKSSEK